MKGNPIPAWSFADFIVSACNENAYQACLNMAQTEEGGFVALHGPSGCGKTHLLTAMQRTYQEAFPQKRVLATTLDDMMTQYIQALQDGRAADYRKTVCGNDLLIVDNMQFVAGKAQTQEELTIWLCQMLDAGKSVAVAFDRPATYFAGILGTISRRYGEKCRIIELFEADDRLRKQYVERLRFLHKPDLPPCICDALTASRRISLGGLRGQLMKLQMVENHKGHPLTEAEMLECLDATG